LNGSHKCADVEEILKRNIGEAKMISAAFPYQNRRGRVLGREMAYVKVRSGQRDLLDG
jgi:hypothetical protein